MWLGHTTSLRLLRKSCQARHDKEQQEVTGKTVDIKVASSISMQFNLRMVFVNPSLPPKPLIWRKIADFRT